MCACTHDAAACDVTPQVQHIAVQEQTLSVVIVSSNVLLIQKLQTCVLITDFKTISWSQYLEVIKIHIT